jgi:ABC-type sulfate/molybdate transport systems ATPase subunit
MLSNGTSDVATPGAASRREKAALPSKHPDYFHLMNDNTLALTTLRGACGRSTLLKLIAGLAAPSAGMIDWSQSTYDAEKIPQQSLGFVFQEPPLLP